MRSWHVALLPFQAIPVPRLFLGFDQGRDRLGTRAVPHTGPEGRGKVDVARGDLHGDVCYQYEGEELVDQA